MPDDAEFFGLSKCLCSVATCLFRKRLTETSKTTKDTQRAHPVKISKDSPGIWVDTRFSGPKHIQQEALICRQNRTPRVTRMPVIYDGDSRICNYYRSIDLSSFLKVGPTASLTNLW